MATTVLQFPWWLPPLIYDAVALIVVCSLRLATGRWREAALWSACLALPALALIAALIVVGPPYATGSWIADGAWVWAWVSPQNVIGLLLLLVVVLPEIVASPNRRAKYGMSWTLWILLIGGTVWTNWTCLFLHDMASG